MVTLLAGGAQCEDAEADLTDTDGFRNAVFEYWHIPVRALGTEQTTAVPAEKHHMLNGCHFLHQ